MTERTRRPDGAADAQRDAEPSMLGYTVFGADDGALGTVVADLRAAYPRNRLVIEHGAWLWRRRSVVARTHVRDADVDGRRVWLDLDRAGFDAMPRW